MAIFYDSEKQITIFSGDNKPNIVPPNTDTFNKWNKNTVYAHLYSKNSIAALIQKF
jgi:hypothetical protein